MWFTLKWSRHGCPVAGLKILLWATSESSAPFPPLPSTNVKHSTPTSRNWTHLIPTLFHLRQSLLWKLHLSLYLGKVIISEDLVFNWHLIASAQWLLMMDSLDKLSSLRMCCFLRGVQFPLTSTKIHYLFFLTCICLNAGSIRIWRFNNKSDFCLFCQVFHC